MLLVIFYFIKQDAYQFIDKVLAAHSINTIKSIHSATYICKKHNHNIHFSRYRTLTKHLKLVFTLASSFLYKDISKMFVI